MGGIMSRSRDRMYEWNSSGPNQSARYLPVPHRRGDCHLSSGLAVGEMGQCFDMWNSWARWENSSCTSWQKADRRASLSSQHFTNHHRNTQQCVCEWERDGERQGEGREREKWLCLLLSQEREKLKNLNDKRGQYRGRTWEEHRSSSFSFLCLNYPTGVTLQREPHLDLSPDWQLT